MAAGRAAASAHGELKQDIQRVLAMAMAQPPPVIALPDKQQEHQKDYTMQHA